MEVASPAITLLLVLLVFTTFVKIATTLSICRYGLGLLGVEFGAVCLVVALGLSVFMCPPELTALGFPDVLLSRSQGVEPRAVADALVPFMQRKIDPSVARHLRSSLSGSSEDSNTAKASVDKQASQAAPQPALRELVPLFVLSELKVAFQIGCLLLIPFVLIDLVSAHVLALLGVQHLGAHVVSLPVKILVFIASGGWGLLGRKILNLE